MTKCIPEEESPDDCLDSPSLVKKDEYSLWGSDGVDPRLHGVLPILDPLEKPRRTTKRTFPRGLFVRSNLPDFVYFGQLGDLCGIFVQRFFDRLGIVLWSRRRRCASVFGVGYVIWRDAQQQQKPPQSPTDHHAGTSSPPPTDQHDHHHCENIDITDKYQDLSLDLVALVFVALAQGILMGTLLCGRLLEKRISCGNISTTTRQMGFFLQPPTMGWGPPFKLAICFPTIRGSLSKPTVRTGPRYCGLPEIIAMVVVVVPCKSPFKMTTRAKSSLFLCREPWSCICGYFLPFSSILWAFWAVLLLLPLLLASSKMEFEFVLNSVAAWFIVELDNVDQRIMVCQRGGRHDDTATTCLPGGGTTKQDPATTTDHRSSSGVLAVAAGDASTSSTTQDLAANDTSFSDSFSPSEPITTNRPSAAALSVISL